MIIEIKKGEDAYKLVADKIIEWRDSQKDYERTNFIVFLATHYANGTEYEYLTAYLEVDNDGIEWNYDWWEGEEVVLLLGITPVEDMEEPMIKFQD